LTGSLHIRIVWACSLLFLIAAAAAAWFHQPVFLLAPFVILGIGYGLQNPRFFWFALLISIPWSIEYRFSSSLGTDLPDEPLMLLTALSMVILLIYKRHQFQHSYFHPLLWIIGFQLLWIVFTTAASTHFLLSLKYLLAKGWYLLAFLFMPLVLLKDRKLLKSSVLLLFASMMIFMIVAIARHAQRGFTFEDVNDALRPFYRNHVNYSALLVCMVPVQVALYQLTVSKKWKLLLAILFLITLVALYFSYARGAWLALIVGSSAYILLRLRLLFFSFLLMIVLTIAGIFYLRANDRYLEFAGDYRTTIFHTNFKEHLIATYKLKDMSNAERIYRWVAGVRMVPENWMTGTGPSSFYREYKPYTVPAFKTWVSENKEQSTVHNYFLLLAIEQGVPGLLIFLVLMASVMWYIENIYQRTGDRFWKVVMAAIASVLVMESVVNFLSDLIETDKMGSLFYISIAIVIIADRQLRSGKETASVTVKP
jgi:O-antigen ligase